MKIGILTYHRAFNYGAFLQALALRSFLLDQGYDVSFIDYWPQYHEDSYKLWEECHDIRSFIRSMMLAQKRHTRFKAFRSAQEKYLEIPDKPLFRDSSDLKDVDADIVIYGSDQIWWKARAGIKGFDDVYWGQHIPQNVKKIAYAASMGVIELTPNDNAEITEYLRNFSGISVRETQLKEALQPLTERNIHVVLDPTLLVPSSFWESLGGKNVPNKEKYILYYKMMNSEKADLFADEMGKKTNLPVITINGNIDSYRTSLLSAETDPISFVSLVKNAEYVISTSFHGVAMSIQFQKEFFAMGMKNNSGRVFSLLSQLGLEERLTDIIPDSTVTAINYDAVYSKLELLRKQAQDYLVQSIQE